MFSPISDKSFNPPERCAIAFSTSSKVKYLALDAITIPTQHTSDLTSDMVMVKARTVIANCYATDRTAVILQLHYLHSEEWNLARLHLHRGLPLVV